MKEELLKLIIKKQYTKLKVYSKEVTFLKVTLN